MAGVSISGKGWFGAHPELWMEWTINGTRKNNTTMTYTVTLKTFFPRKSNYIFPGAILTVTAKIGSVSKNFTLKTYSSKWLGTNGKASNGYYNPLPGGITNTVTLDVPSTSTAALSYSLKCAEGGDAWFKVNDYNGYIVNKSGALPAAPLLSYKVSFNVNGGSGSVAARSCTSGSSITLPSGPSRASKSTKTNFTIYGNSNGGAGGHYLVVPKTVTTIYTFKGWGTSASATSTLAPGASYKPAKDVTLYAIWTSSTNTTYGANTVGDLIKPTRDNEEVLKYKVTLDLQGGVSDQTVFNTITFDKFDFKGWGDTPTSTTPIPTSTAYTSNKTVYAIWKDTVLESYDTIKLPEPSRPNYVFKGYATSSGGTPTIQPGDFTPTANVKLYAIWEESKDCYVMAYLGNKRIDLYGTEVLLKILR